MLDSKELYRAIQRRIPKFKIVDKRKSRFMKFLNLFVYFFNPAFMSSFITTVGFTAYWPDWPDKQVSEQTKFSRMWHEGIHALQGKRLTRICFAFLYLFPQCLFVFALLSLLAIWFSLWWLVALTALVALAPWPAPWRVKFELEAYHCQFIQPEPDLFL